MAGERRSHLAGDVVLDGKDVVQRSVVASRPEPFLRASVDQLDRDPYLVSGLANAPLEGQPDTQVLGHLADGLRGALVLEDRGPRDHPEARHAGNLRDELVGHPVREEFVVRVRAQVGQRQNRETKVGSPVGLCPWDRGRRAREQDTIDFDRILDVLELPGAYLLEREPELVADLVEDGPGHADPARVGPRLDPGGNVDRVADDVVPVFDHIADMDPDPQYDRLVGVRRGVPRGTASWIAVALRTDSTALGNSPRKPSPSDLTSRPPWATKIGRTSAWCSRRNRRAASSSRSPSLVNPTRSVNMTAARRRELPVMGPVSARARVKACDSRARDGRRASAGRGAGGPFARAAGAAPPRG